MAAWRSWSQKVPPSLAGSGGVISTKKKKEERMRLRTFFLLLVVATTKLKKPRREAVKLPHSPKTPTVQFQVDPAQLVSGLRVTR